MTYYLLGIKGAGVSSLACILSDLGNRVVGYDDVEDYRFTEEELKRRNIEIKYSNEFYEEGMIVIHSAAFKVEHKEIQRLKELNVEFRDYQTTIGELSRQYNTISVAGTHGKTTTTSLISQLFNKVNNYNCNYFIGDGHGSAALGNEYFILESCEFNKHFLHYSPNISIITNIEIEHMEVFKDLDDIIDTYNQLIKNTNKHVVVCADSEYCLKLDNSDNKIIYYGISDKANIQAREVVYHPSGVSFELYYNNELYDIYNLPFYGKHMLQNVLATITVCMLEKMSKEDIKNYIGEFRNAKRRFEEEFVYDMVVVDDYAHHPTEVRATILSAVQKYPDKELIVVFRPNTYSRTKLLYKDFGRILCLAEHVYITDIYCDREKQEDYKGISSKLIMDECPKAKHISTENIYDLVKHENSVICFMSCKDINDLKGAYLSLLKRKEERQRGKDGKFN